MADKEKGSVQWPMLVIMGSLVVALTSGMWNLVKHLVGWEHRVTVVEQSVKTNTRRTEVLLHQLNRKEDKEE